MIANFSIKQRIAIVFFLVCIFSGLTMVASWLSIQIKVGDTIYPATTIDGIDMDYKTKEEALALLQKRDDYFQTALIEVLYKDQPIASFSGEQLALERDIETKVDQAYLIGRTPHLPSRLAQQMNGVLRIRTFPFTTEIRYDEDQVKQFIAETAETYERPAKDALFQFEDGKVISFKTHENGLKLNTDIFLADIKNAIQQITPLKQHFPVAITDTVVEPEITLARANKLGIEELIGEGKSDYTHSIASRIHNIILAASRFNGVIIQQGETFSFNKVLGDISANTGYQPAYVIKNGRTVLGDGGGVCQVSTTAFRAALNSGLPIVERHAHAYRVSYYENDSEPGFDATIFSPSVDLQFKNDTRTAILIQTAVDEEHKILTFRFYGKKDDRRVEISPATVWGIAPPPEPLYEDDPTLAAGVVKQVDYAAWGAKTKFDYKVYAATGELLQDVTFYSSFRPWQAVFLRGTAGA